MKNQRSRWWVWLLLLALAAFGVREQQQPHPPAGSLVLHALLAVTLSGSDDYQARPESLFQPQPTALVTREKMFVAGVVM